MVPFQPISINRCSTWFLWWKGPPQLQFLKACRGRQYTVLKGLASPLQWYCFSHFYHDLMLSYRKFEKGKHEMYHVSFIRTRCIGGLTCPFNLFLNKFWGKFLTSSTFHIKKNVLPWFEESLRESYKGVRSNSIIKMCTKFSCLPQSVVVLVTHYSYMRCQEMYSSQKGSSVIDVVELFWGS